LRKSTEVQQSILERASAIVYKHGAQFASRFGKDESRKPSPEMARNAQRALPPAEESFPSRPVVASDHEDQLRSREEALRQREKGVKERERLVEAIAASQEKKDLALSQMLEKYTQLLERDMRSKDQPPDGAESSDGKAEDLEGAAAAGDDGAEARPQEETVAEVSDAPAALPEDPARDGFADAEEVAFVQERWPAEPDAQPAGGGDILLGGDRAVDAGEVEMPGAAEGPAGEGEEAPEAEPSEAAAADVPQEESNRIPVKEMGD